MLFSQVHNILYHLASNKACFFHSGVECRCLFLLLNCSLPLINAISDKRNKRCTQLVCKAGLRVHVNFAKAGIPHFHKYSTYVAEYDGILLQNNRE